MPPRTIFFRPTLSEATKDDEKGRREDKRESDEYARRLAVDLQAHTQLSLPGDRPDDRRQALLSDLQRPAQASRITVGPGALDQHPARSRVAGLCDGAAPDLLPVERSEGTRPR